MKKIAITQRLLLNESYYEVREALDIKWALLLKELNFLPIVLPTQYDFEEYFNTLGIDGILLTGGNDLNSVNENKESSLRDEFEKKLIKYAIKYNTPIFGVCRGMHIIAEYFGSDLAKVQNQVNIKHKLQINKKSKYYDRLNTLEKVNSYHNYSINNISNDFLVSAWGENQIIKAIEHKKYKIFAQMWHSERENPFNENELNLIKEFFND